MDQQPLALAVQGRSEPTQHESARFTVEPFRARQPPRVPELPVAALPQRPGEVFIVQRAKRRPAVALSAVPPEVPRELRTGGARWQTSRVVSVAPYYGIDQGGTRSGWRPEFVDRIRRCEYPQYSWDLLPLSSRTTSESLLRLDQLQPLGAHAEAYELTPFKLSDEALEVMEEWLWWHVSGTLDPESVLAEVRRILLEGSSS